MEPHLDTFTFTFWHYLIPTFLFCLALYIGVVPKRNTNPGKNRIILSGIGIAFGLFCAFKIIIVSRGKMNYLENLFFTQSIMVMAWSIYYYNTRPSKLTKSKKIWKVIIYFFITDFWGVSCISNYNLIILISCFLIITLMILARYTGCLENKKNLSNIAFFTYK